MKVLMVLALLKPNKKEEVADLKMLFRQFDSGDAQGAGAGDGVVTLVEMSARFNEVGVEILEDDMAGLVFLGRGPHWNARIGT